MQYTTLSTADRLLLARDALRGRESDHFRLSLLDESSRGDRLEVLAAEIDTIRKEVSALEKQAAKEERAAARAVAKQRKGDDPAQQED